MHVQLAACMDIDVFSVLIACSEFEYTYARIGLWSILLIVSILFIVLRVSGGLAEN